MTIRCSQGHENPDNAAFCNECGESLPTVQVSSLGEEPTVPAAGPVPAPDQDITTQAAPPPASPATEVPAAPSTGGVAGDQEATVGAPPSPTASDQEATVAMPGSMPASDQQAIMAPPPPPPPVPAPAQPRLIVEGHNATFDLTGKTTVVVGREDAPSNSFPDWDLTPYGAEEGGVSRLHARLTQSGEHWTIEDLDSTNHTFINHKRIPPKTPTPLNDGDEVRLGRVVLHFKITA